jgi:GAF domain-containing protein
MRWLEPGKPGKYPYAITAHLSRCSGSQQRQQKRLPADALGQTAKITKHSRPSQGRGTIYVQSPSQTHVWTDLFMEEWERLLDELHSELSLRERELDLLHAIDQRLLGEHSPQEIFTFIVVETQDLIQADHAAILLRRSTFLEPMYSSLASVVGQRVPISESLTGLSLETDAVVNVPDLMRSELRTKYTPLRGYEGPPMRSLLATPIKIGDTIVGVLNAESTKANVFKQVHERIATTVASEVAIALQRTQTLASTILFADIDRLMLASDDSPDAAQQSEHVIQVALEKVMSELRRLEHVHHTGAQIMFLRGQDQLEIVHSTNPSYIGLTVPVAMSVSGRAVRERRSVIVGDVSGDEEYQPMLGSSIRSEIAVPILFGEDDIVIGVLNVASSEPDAFYGFYQVVLENFAQRVRTLLAFAKLRADVTEALELRSADDLLLAVGDQTSHMIHRLNSTVGQMRFRIKELQGLQDENSLRDDFLKESLSALLALAESTLMMPNDLTLRLADERTMVDINKCVKEAIRKLEVPKNVVLSLQLEDHIPPQPLYCFDIVVQNLLQNALDAMPEGGDLFVSTSVVLDPMRSTGYMQLSIRDTGNGIPADVQRHMFERNFSTKRRKGIGLGFGLWWVRTFVRRARGDVTIISEVGSGTEAIVKVPIDKPSDTLQKVDTC